MHPIKLDMFLDSGAFSAWTQGVEVNVDSYISFIKEHQSALSTYAVLDVIGDAKATAKNQKKMEDAGLRPLPCFHIGEDFSFLKYYIDNYEYFAIGGIAKMGGSPTMFKFLNKVFDMVCDSEGNPRNKLHGFGVTSIQAMALYPWYSVDSTSWLMTSRMGSLFIPRQFCGKWDFLEKHKKAHKIAFSYNSPKKGEFGAHYSQLNASMSWLVHAWLDFCGIPLGESSFKRVGPKYELKKGERFLPIGQAKAYDPNAEKKSWVEEIHEVGVRNDYICRDICNAKYFLEVEKEIPEYPWKWKRPRMKGFGFI